MQFNKIHFLGFCMVLFRWNTNFEPETHQSLCSTPRKNLLLVKKKCRDLLMGGGIEKHPLSEAKFVRQRDCWL